VCRRRKTCRDSRRIDTVEPMVRMLLSLGLVAGALGGAAGCAPASVARAQPARSQGRAERPREAVAEPLGADLAAARAALGSVPGLARFSQAFVPFSDADADAALRRGGHSREHVQPWSIMASSFVWRPEPGTALWVLSGRSGAQALLVLLHRRSDGHFEHAASLVVDEPDATIAIGSSEQYPKQLVWSTCYLCAGEGGTVRLGDDGRVELTYR
jgi:hypothetical protein